MLSKNQGQKLNTYVSDYCVFDLETTGTSYKSDAIIEISAVKVIDGKVAAQFTSLVNPGLPISVYATAVNGITDDMVADAPIIDDALADFLDFVGDMILVGHNIHSFDMKFICRDAMRIWGKNVGNDYVDTLPLARKYLPQLSNHKLTDLAMHYGIDPEGAHRALYDCKMNQEVYERLGMEIVNPSKLVENAPVCPKCGNDMVRRNGIYGNFWGCSGYPACKFTQNIK